MDYEKELNKEQYEAVRYVDGPLRIFAGAGSGKTRTLVYRVAYMVEQGILPEQILLLTFTNKAAGEMKERAEKILKEKCGITACTYHSFCNMMLRKYADRIGWQKDFTIINGSDAGEIINILKTEHKYNKYRGFPQGKVIAGMVSASKNKEISLKDVVCKEYTRFRGYVTEIQELAQEYEEYKQKRFLMDYDDLLVHFLELITKREDIRDLIANQYKYIMVDEYQDTNNIQEKIILRLREKVKNIAVVGDDYQSIYAFRGSNVNNILEFADKMEGVKTIKLIQNYRSGQPILDVANNVMKNNATEGVYKEMTSNLSCNLPRMYTPESQFEERDIVVDIVRRELRKRDPKEIAILERKANESAMIEAELTAWGIPFVKYGGLKFFDKSFVQDVLSFLRVITNPHDEIAWFRILRLYPGIGEIYSQKLSKMAVDNNESFLINNSYKRRKFFSELNQLYNEYQTWKDIPFPKILDVVINYYYDLREKYIKQENLSDESVRDTLLEENKEAKEELQILKTMAEEYKTLPQFLDAIVLDATKKDEENGIVISTIHSAKGLEFEVVIILDCSDGFFPSTTRIDKGSKEDNEELRCFYVAITRAKEQLHLFCPQSIKGYYQAEYKEPSHYLDECENLVDKIDF